MATRRSSSKTKETAATAKAAASRADGASEDGAVRVRMYCQGLGDCFLLRFPTDDGGTFSVLIDCGVIIGTPNAADRMKLVIDDLAKETKGTIDLVVGTHEHWDHLSGFDLPPGYFADKIKIKKVWLAWTEDKKDPVTKKLIDDRTEKKKALARAVQKVKMRLGADAPEVDEAASVLGFFGIDVTDDADLIGQGGPVDKIGRAMQFLRDHEATYCEPGTVQTLPGVAGVNVYVLGPPRDQDQLFRDLPTKKDAGTVTYGLDGVAFSLEAYCGLEQLVNFASAPEPDEHRLPFDGNYRIPEESAAHDPFYQQRYYFADDDWRRIDGDWAGDVSRFALKLDSYTNNMSLALAFELPDRQVLLFPGDAQVGNWESWHEDSKGNKQIFTLGYRKVTAADLLDRTVLYKVAHHGSHNATLKEDGLELMKAPGLVAMIPCEIYTAHVKKRWTKMPFQPILDDLTRQKVAVLQADQKAKDEKLPPGMPAPQREAFLANVAEGPKILEAMYETPGQVDSTKDPGVPDTRPLWYEYTIHYAQPGKAD